MAKNKIYLVEIKKDTYRTFHNWPECQAFVHGTSYAFASGLDATEALAKLKAGQAKLHAAQGKTIKTQNPTKNNSRSSKSTSPIPTSGLTSDAGTHGNPGPCEYQVTDIKGNVLLHKQLGVHTNNYAELAGIGAMIQYAIGHGETLLWTDSKIAMGWIKTGKLGPSVREPELIMKLIQKIQRLLNQNPQLELKKWHTRTWGQIPSDFGRKS